MEIQWVMLAKEFRTNPDGTMCIDGIFHHISNALPDENITMMLIAKVRSSITEAGNIKEVGVAVEHVEKGVVWINKLPYQIHDVSSVLNKKPYMIIRLIDIKFPFSGEYTFKMFVDREYKNEESITVSLRGG